MDVKALIGKRFQDARKEKGLTQDAVSEKVGISPKYLSSIERGQANPTLDLLLTLSETLKTPIWDLFDVAEELKGRAELRRLLTSLLQKADESTLRAVVKVLRLLPR